MSYAAPVHIDKAGIGATLRRVSFNAVGEDRFNEVWLQDLLYRYPESVPFRDVDPSLGVVVPLCREMYTTAGPVDIVFITTTGKLILVETKLFRNPQARREVVGQILDYAKELTSWRYEQLAAKVASAAKRDSSYLLEAVRAKAGEFNEAVFVDSVNRSLSRADMALLIVGDGIQTGAEALVGFLENRATLQFSLGLVEVAVFEAPDGGRLIQPRVLAKTELLRRTLLVGTSGESVPTATPEGMPDADVERTWQQQFWTEMLAQLKLDDITQPIPPKPPRGTNAYFPMPPSGSVAWVSAYIASSKKEVGVYIVLSASHPPFKAIFDQWKEDRSQVEKELGLAPSWDAGERSYTVGVKRKYVDINEPVERANLIAYLCDATNRFVNTFRPRLIDAAREGS